MAFDIRMQGNFRPDPAAFRAFKSAPNGPVGSDLRRRGARLAMMAKSTVPKDTGALAASIKSSYHVAPNPWVMVGSDLDYARVIHEGANPHVIQANPGKMLRFKVRGRIVYARKVNHPGTRATRYLTRHLRKVVND